MKSIKYIIIGWLLLGAVFHLAAQEKPRLSVDADFIYEEEGKVFQGMPLAIYLRIFAHDSVKVGNPERSWVENIQFLLLDKEEQSILPDTMNWDPWLFFKENGENQFYLGEKRFVRSWIIPSEFTIEMPKGDCSVQIIYSTEGLEETHPDLWIGEEKSNKLELKVVKTETKADSARVLYQTAKVAQMQADFENVVPKCQEALKLDPKFLLPYICMGEGFEGQGELQKAVESFEIYMQAAQKTGQQYPYLLAGKILDLKDKLKNQ